MILEIRQIGNSAGLTIPKKMLEAAHLSIGDKVEAKNFELGIFIEPVKPRKKYKIKDLLMLCNTENMKLNYEDKEWLAMQDLGKEGTNE
jgi:antitoxin component of MazEF toxin-antitoxin module